MFGDYLADDASGSERKDLLSELDLMKQLKLHPYVIKLLGCVTKSGKLRTCFTYTNGFTDVLLTVLVYT